MSDEEFRDDARTEQIGSLAKMPANSNLSSTCSKHDGRIVRPFYKTCPQCEGDKNRLNIDRLAGVVRELKESITFDLDDKRERELVGLLELYQHPDPKGFMGWLAAAREQARTNPRSKPRGRGHR